MMWLNKIPVDISTSFTVGKPQFIVACAWTIQIKTCLSMTWDIHLSSLSTDVTGGCFVKCRITDTGGGGAWALLCWKWPLPPWWVCRRPALLFNTSFISPPRTRNGSLLHRASSSVPRNWMRPLAPRKGYPVGCTI
jgi:hypothetical protein